MVVRVCRGQWINRFFFAQTRTWHFRKRWMNCRAFKTEKIPQKTLPCLPHVCTVEPQLSLPHLGKNGLQSPKTCPTACTGWVSGEPASSPLGLWTLGLMTPGQTSAGWLLGSSYQLLGHLIVLMALIHLDSPSCPFYPWSQDHPFIYFWLHRLLSACSVPGMVLGPGEEWSINRHLVVIMKFI